MALKKYLHLNGESSSPLHPSFSSIFDSVLFLKSYKVFFPPPPPSVAPKVSTQTLVCNIIIIEFHRKGGIKPDKVQRRQNIVQRLLTNLFIKNFCFLKYLV